MILKLPCPGIGFGLGPIAVGVAYVPAGQPVLDGAMLAPSWDPPSETSPDAVDIADLPGDDRTEAYRQFYTGLCVRFGRNWALVFGRRGWDHVYRRTA